MDDAAQLGTDRWRRKYVRERKARLEAEAIAERFTRDALHDPLTGLANRTLFLDRLQHALSATGRHRMPLATVILDLDGFKEINDSYGHSVGDELLCAVAKRLTEVVRSIDTVARLGGDEFALLIEDVDEAGKEIVIERIKRALVAPFFIQGEPRQIAGSFGMVLSRGNIDSPMDMLRRADMAMYAAKRDGKKVGHAIFESGMHTAMVFRLEMKSSLQRALMEREFVMHYQPVVELPGGRITGMEALVRWNRPDGGLVEPNEFIPLAEETSVIVPLGWWILEESCRQFKLWCARSTCKDLILHVNLSALQLHDPHATAQVEDALSKCGLPADRLVLELTETSIMRDVESSQVAMKKLTTHGVRMAIDDFGTGYSSLSYLQKLPVSVLKIDKSFIDSVAESKQAAALVRAIIGVGAALELQVVAEGVERVEQVGRLQALNCRYAQGYFFSRPLDAAAMEDYLARH